MRALVLAAALIMLPAAASAEEPKPDTCTVVEADLAAVVQIFESQWAGDACLEDRAASAALDFRAACRGPVAFGSETAEDAVGRIVNKHMRQCGR